MSNNNEDSQTYDNKKENDKHVMNNTDLDNTKVLINKDNVLESTKSIYEYLPLQAHCNKYDIEKWQDWFCIPNYYINNNYAEGEKALIDIDTNDVSACYKPCYVNDVKDSLIIRKGNIKQCMYKSTYLNGKYSGYTIFDPFSIICLYGSTTSTIKDIDKKGSYLYKLNEISKKKDNSNWNNEEYELAKDINKIDINIIDNVIKNPDIFISSIITDIEKSKEIYELYIKNIIDTEVQETLIKKKISDDIFEFNNLLTSNDFYYMTYLNKISDNYGIDYAFEVSKSLNNKKSSDNKISDKSISKNIKKYVDFALKYACYTCFSKQSEYYNNMINKVNIIKEDSIIISPERENVCELPNIEIDEIKSQNIIFKNIEPVIEKNDIVLFSIYNSFYEYFKSLALIFYIIIITVVVFAFIIGVCIYFNLLKYIITYFINYSYIFMFEIHHIFIAFTTLFLLGFINIFIRYIFSKKIFFASILIIILIIITFFQYLFGNKNAFDTSYYIIIDTFTAYITLMKNIILLMYRTTVVSLPLTILIIFTYLYIIRPHFSIISKCNFLTAGQILGGCLRLYKTNFYKDNLISYNLNISQYQQQTAIVIGYNNTMK